MRWNFLSIFVVVPALVFGRASLQECATIAGVVPYITEDTLVVFDIDDTLLHTRQMFGSSVWFDTTFQRTATAEARQELIELSEAILTVTDVEPMEEITSQEVTKLQHMHVPVMAMTSRSGNIRTVTTRQLHSLGIDFLHSAPTSVLFSLQNVPGSTFSQGILFTSGGHKGVALKEFLRQIQQFPKKIIYVNDRPAPLEEVASVLGDSLEYIGLRYLPADELSKQYDPTIAALQSAAFQVVMSNTTARKFLDAWKAP
jgi:hypothetical protein